MISFFLIQVQLQTARPTEPENKDKETRYSQIRFQKHKYKKQGNDPQGKLNNKKREIQKFTMVEGGLIAGDLEHAASPTKNPQNIKKTFQKPKAETVPNTKSQTKNKASKTQNTKRRATIKNTKRNKDSKTKKKMKVFF